jgi:uncharacterized protein YhhL (DUF1145 family)
MATKIVIAMTWMAVIVLWVYPFARDIMNFDPDRDDSQP